MTSDGERVNGRHDDGGLYENPPGAALCQAGVFDDFSSAWLACLREVVRGGTGSHDGPTALREVLNLSVSARRCTRQSLVGVGAAPDRLALMVRKYESRSVLPEYKVSYGNLFRDHEGVDQLAWVVDRLRAKPETKSATIGFHQPGHPDLSCISLVDCKLRDGLLHINAVFRSQNIFGSQPGNALALARLQQRIAAEIGAETGFLTLHVLSAHVYFEDMAAAERLLRQHALHDRHRMLGATSSGEVTV
jgi:thymidylate synthase